MEGEYINLKQRTVEEKEKTKDSARIITRYVKADIDYNERIQIFKNSITKMLSPTMNQDEIVTTVVEAALVSEFSDEIFDYQAYDNMKDTIASALLKDKDLKTKIMNLAARYSKSEAH